MNRIAATSIRVHASAYLVGMIEIETGNRDLEENGLPNDSALDELLAQLVGAKEPCNPRDRYILPATRVAANLASLSRDLDREVAQLRAALATASR